MMKTDTRHPAHPDLVKRMDTTQLREHFLIDDLFSAGVIRLVYSHHDRMIVGGVETERAEVVLDKVAEAGTESLLDRREIGIACVHGKGTVAAGGESYMLGDGDMLYLGQGAGAITFGGEARFYLISTPAHRPLPAKHIRISDAASVDLGSKEGCNERTIYQFIHPDVLETCQLVMGFTKLAPGSIWNTMPAHLHDRRSEVYFYRDVPEDQRVFHFMGEAQETRHVVMANHQAVISPSWSIHSGAGTANYSFIWAMGGDNIDYTDVEMVEIGSMK
ncbi:5-dehydro-4-deoxy-D-glucuronate isomerase [Qingshengfaniella alkalisoli]|uniref:4-deoxy-L-threo-5-hexosulose-uronate ketol-isomerase n=1 Tax=Qingshengfaniella alkalisoli TaxID=2599296 RepID=A0A5B8IYS9_9RHOB|nr:5-dehydro-4-deoxy-D-glucuronate isomerase [Qingshengfaniella alkalisoli]QDY70874.1 5-dehydro-4-deoxy-D-glucuronate isomerase [Qingshengfaniella alkalisoli]